MKSVFLDASGRVRSGWRAIVFLFAFFFVLAVFSLVEAPYSLTLPRSDPQVRLHLLNLESTFMLAVSLILGGVAASLFERLPFSSLGARCRGQWLKHFLLGSLFGTVSLSFAVLIAFVFGGERFAFNTDGKMSAVAYSLVLSFGIFAVAAAAEEALFRGYLLQTFARSGLAWLAVLLTSVFFGLVHLGNPNASALSTINTVLAGLWFSIGYWRTRDLWFVWGLHLMWNWMQGSFFGIEVSGLTTITTSPLLTEIDTGPTWLTGTTYGIEGGIACTIAIIVSSAAIYFMPGIKPDADLLAMTSHQQVAETTGPSEPA